jgi:4-hydroxybenzoate polyprenyltransferase
MHFIRLLRPINLIIIILTMYAMRWFFMEFLVYQHPIVDLQGEAVDFILLVFSTVLIAGAGNIINDYFDVKADRINKPNRLIITKH